MNRKKINKLISSTISVIYLANSSPVFALESQSKEESLLSEESLNTENNDINTIEPTIEDVENNAPSIDKDNTTEEIKDSENINKDEDIKTEDSEESSKNEEIVENVSDSSNEKDNTNTEISKENEKVTEDLEINQNVDKNSKISVQNVTAPTTICAPTISYSNGFVTIKDNGIISTNLNITETFDNPNNTVFEFSNSDWNISSGVMTSKKIYNSQNTKNTIVLNLDMDCKLTIKAKVSSEKNNDWGTIDVNGTNIFKQSGTENFNYTTVTHNLKKGINTIDFKYTKNYGYFDGLDAMFIDEIKIAAEDFQANSERIEYRLNGGEWETYSAPFECEEGTLVECRSVYNSNYSDTVSSNLNFVQIPDENLNQILKDMLNKDETNPYILIEELKNISGILDLRNKNISDLSGLEYTTNLTGLLLSDNPINDISIIERLPNLETLIAKNLSITDITSILNTPSLKTIDLEGDITYTEEDLENLATMPNLVSLTAKFNAPNTILNIGSEHFPKAEILDLKESIFKEVYSSNTSSLKTINLTNGEFYNFIIDNVNSLSFVNLDNATTNDISVTNCNNIEDISVKKITADSLTLQNLYHENSLQLTLDYSNFNNVLIDNITSITAHFNCSSVTIDNLIIKNSLFENGNFYGTKINTFNLNENNRIRYFNANNLNIKDTLDFTGLDFKNINGGSIICPNIIIANCPNAQYISLDYITSNNVIVENCPNAESVTFGSANIDNVSVKNMDSLSYLSIWSLNCLNLNVENCISLTGLSNNPKAKIKNFRLINVPNLSGRDLSESNIETVIMENCNSFDNLNLSSNNIKDISGISSLTSLPALDISNNHITDISSLKDITSLTPENISASNQTIILEDIISKAGTVSIKSPTIIDYNGDKLNGVVKTDTSSKIKTVDDLVLGEFEEGIYNINIEFNSDLVDYSLIASQKVTVDGTAPSITLTQNNVNWTKNPVLVTIEAADDISGVDYIKLPNGDIINDTTFEFEVTQNGDYEFEVADLVGNISKKTITISNIDNLAPTLNTSVTYNEDNTEAIIKIEVTDSLSGVLNITLPDGQVVEETTTSFTATKNGDYLIAVTDVAMNTYIETIKVDKIQDKPTSDDNTNNDSNNNTTPNNPSDDESNDDVTNDNNSNNNTNDNNSNNNNNSNTENNLDKLPNSSGVGVFAPIVAMMSLAIGALSFKKKK